MPLGSTVSFVTSVRVAASAIRSADPRVSSPPAAMVIFPSADPVRVVVLPLRTVRSPVKVLSPPRLISPGPADTAPSPLMRHTNYLRTRRRRLLTSKRVK